MYPWTSCVLLEYFQQLAALLITRQVIGNFREAILPYFIEKAKLFKIGYRMVEAMSPETLEKQMKRISESEIIDPTSDDMDDDAESKKNRRESTLEDIYETDLLTDDGKLPREDIKVSDKGLTLSQAEVEAVMKKVISLTCVSPNKRFCCRMEGWNCSLDHK